MAYGSSSSVRSRDATKVKCLDGIGRESWVMGRAVAVGGGLKKNSIQNMMLAPSPLVFSVAYGIGGTRGHRIIVAVVVE